MKKFKIFTIFLKTYWQEQLEYRVGSLIWVITGSIGPLISMAIWLAVSQSNTLPLNQPQIATYFFFSVLVTRLTQVWSLEQVGNMIKDGEISITLLKPHSYVLENFAEQLGHKFIRLAMLIPLMILGWIIFNKQLVVNFELWRITLASIATIFGFLLLFWWEQVLALIAFWTPEVAGVVRVQELVKSFFSGALIPLAFMPNYLKGFMTIFPARFTASFPLEILVEKKSGGEIFWGFVIGFIWLIAFIVLHKVLFKAGIKRYTAIGG